MPPSRVRGSLAVGAVAVPHDALDLLERRLGAELASVRPRSCERVRRELAHRPQRASVGRVLPSPHRARPGTRTRRPPRAFVAARRRLLGEVPGEPLHQRAEPGNARQRGLAVHRAQLDRPEPRVRPHLPPDERVVRQARPLRSVRCDDRLVVGEVVESRAGCRRAGSRGEALAARSRARSRARARRASSPRAPRAAEAIRAGRCRRGSPSRRPACRRARAGRSRECA